LSRPPHSLLTRPDVTAQCTAYNYPPVAAIINDFPTNWAPATLVQGDQEAAALFAQLNQTLGDKVANVQVKVGTMGDFSGYQYDNAADPDCWWTKTRCTKPKDESIPADIDRLPEPNTWGFGYDDGPNCSHNALYNFMAENKQKATMFFIGSNVMNWPLQALRAKQDGHELCIHTWSHSAMTTLSNEGAFAELYYTRQAIKAVTGVTPKCWRPPYGDVDNRIRAIAGFLNLTNILWSDDTFDWQEGSNNITAETIKGNYQKVFDKAKNGEYNTYGAIVLNHEINNKTMQHMIEEYPKIKENFKYIVPIAAGMNWTTPYAEANETYPDFNQYTSGQLTGGPVASGEGNSPGSTMTGGSSSANASATATAGPNSGATRNTAGLLAAAGAAVAMLL
jgi:peptidoglycan/xylan/chitin deacetylase (PgdA/CDA1 family)